MPLNWFGLETHETDTYIHWSERGKSRLKKAEQLREVYDKIKDAGLKKELDVLLSAAYSAGQDDERDVQAEMNAGPDW